jgi:hypothetical protein
MSLHKNIKHCIEFCSTLSTFQKSGAKHWIEFSISTFLKAYSWFCSTFLKSGKGGKNKIDYFFTN